MERQPTCHFVQVIIGCVTAEAGRMGGFAPHVFCLSSEKAKSLLTSENYFLMIFARDFALNLVAEIMEYFVHFVIFGTQSQVERSGHIAKGYFLEVPFYKLFSFFLEKQINTP